MDVNSVPCPSMEQFGSAVPTTNPLGSQLRNGDPGSPLQVSSSPPSYRESTRTRSDTCTSSSVETLHSDGLEEVASKYADSFENKSLSEDATVPPTLQSCWNWLNHIIADTWFCEILSWVLSFFCLLCVLIILWRYDNRELPHLPYGITVGALVSLFTTLSVTLLMVTVSSGLSQLKWLHYADRARNLSDLEKFDGASRGIWGSIILLLSRRQRFISRLGCIITLLVIGSNTLTQQAIGYETHQVSTPGGIAVAPRATYFGSFNNLTGVMTGFYTMPSLPESNTMGAILSGVLHDGPPVSFKAPQCSTGNCTWPSYKTLAICSSVTDVSHLVVSTYKGGLKNFMVELPDIMTLNVTWGSTLAIKHTGYILENLLDGILPFWSGNNAKSISFSHLENSTIADFFVLWSEITSPLVHNPPISRAVEVNLHFCVKHLRSNVTNSIAYTEELPAPPAVFQYPEGTVLQRYVDLPNPNGRMHANPNATAVVNGSDEVFGFSRRAQQSLYAFINSQFAGTWTLWVPGWSRFREKKEKAAFGFHQICNVIRSPDKRPAFPFHFHGYKKLFEDYARNMAMILTNHIRSESVVVGHPAQGTAYKIVTLIRVSWAWLTLLEVLVAASFVFLLSIIWVNRSHRVKLWRSSNIALVQAIDPFTRPPAICGIYNNIPMERQAGEIRMRLEAEKEVWRLVDKP